MTLQYPLDSLAKKLASIAWEAGLLLKKIQSDSQDVHRKADGTPSCSADTASEALILKRLHAAFPSIPIISEEQVKDSGIGERFFLVDPLDGTADFIEGGTEYCVNIALIERSRPVAAVIHAPVTEQTWLAGETVRATAGSGAESRPIAARAAPPRGLVALTSNRYGDSITETWLDALPLGSRRRLSSAVKFCIVAEGMADLYLRHGRTMEWDTAAGDLILTLAGGVIVGLDGLPLTYGRAERDYANDAFIAVGDPALIPAILDVLQKNTPPL